MAGPALSLREQSRYVNAYAGVNTRVASCLHGSTVKGDLYEVFSLWSLELPVR